MKKTFSEEFPLSISSQIIEKTVDEQRRTVIAGVLQEDSLSANNRFYPAKVVRKAIRALEGKKSLMGHDTNNPADIVAKIDRSFMKGGVGFGEFKFGKDTHSEMILSKIKEGLIDATSIRASGVTKRGKIGDQIVDVVEELDIASVDFVIEGGVAAAKVTQVFESSPTIIYDDSNNSKIKEKKRMDDLAKLQAQLDEQNKKIEDLSKTNEDLKSAKDDSDSKLAEQKLESYKSKKLSGISDKEVRGMVLEQLSADSEKGIDEQFTKQVAYHEKIRKAAGLKKNEIPVMATDTNGNDKPLSFRDVNEFMNSKEVPASVKEEALLSILKN